MIGPEAKLSYHMVATDNPSENSPTFPWPNKYYMSDVALASSFLYSQLPGPFPGASYSNHSS